MDRYRTIISALFTAISYQYFWPGILISLTPMLNRQWNKATLLIWGTLYMAASHLFLINLHDDTLPIIAIGIWLLCSVYFGLFYGLGGLIMYFITKNSKQNLFIYLPIIWPIMEYLKSVGSFGNPNGNLGFALSEISPFLPTFSIIGNLGICSLIICINILIVQFIQSSKKMTYLIAIISIGLFAIIPISNNATSDKSVSVNVIQTSIAQYKKINTTFWPELKTNYIESILKTDAELVILPESIIPSDFRSSLFFKEIQTISNIRNQYFLIGGFIRENGFYNGSYFFSQIPPILYKKQRLMPFGETLPFRSIITKFVPSQLLFNDFDKGKSTIDMPFKLTSIRPVICLEGIYGDFYDSQSIIAILANNAWFNNSSAGHKLKKFAKYMQLNTTAQYYSQQIMDNLQLFQIQAKHLV